MSVHVLLNFLNELEKIDEMRGLQSILSLFRNEFKAAYSVTMNIFRKILFSF